MVDLRELLHEVVRLEIELWNATDARLRADLDLPLAHYEPMSVMARVAGCRICDIAGELVVTTGGASKLVDRIEARGHCRRRANPHDRRSSFVELTPAGCRILARAHAVVDDELRHRIGDAASDRAFEQFMATLARLRAAMQRAGAERTA
jgi:DNA-binding MarR family transcriptional regulator